MTCWCYILECELHPTLYVGITDDLNRRYNQHKKGKGALYTKLNGVGKLLYAIELFDRSAARNLEIRLKRLSHKKKRDFISKNSSYYKPIPSSGAKELLMCSLPPEEPSFLEHEYHSYIDLSEIEPIESFVFLRVPPKFSKKIKNLN